MLCLGILIKVLYLGILIKVLYLGILIKVLCLGILIKVLCLGILIKGPSSSLPSLPGETCRGIPAVESERSVLRVWELRAHGV